MSYLESLKLEYFQSHKVTELTFSPGVNVIVGQSDSGKSAIIRAIKLLAYNKPAGEAFRSSFAGKHTTRVTGVFGGNTITRARGNTKNSYEVNGKELKAMGTGVPSEVAEVFPLGELNYKEQIGTPFLLSQSAGQIAKRINEVANLEIIDISLKNINAMVRKSKQDVEVAEEEVARFENDLEQYEELVYIEDGVVEYEKLEIENHLLWDKIQHLKNLIQSVEEAEATLQKTQSVLELKPKILRCKDLHIVIEDMLSSINSLSNGIRDFTQTHYVYVGTELPDVSKKIKKADTLQQKIYEFSDECVKLCRDIGVMGNLMQSITTLEQEIGDLHNEFDKRFPDQCPLCGK